MFEYFTRSYQRHKRIQRIISLSKGHEAYIVFKNPREFVSGEIRGITIRVSCSFCDDMASGVSDTDSIYSSHYIWRKASVGTRNFVRNLVHYWPITFYLIISILVFLRK